MEYKQLTEMGTETVVAVQRLSDNAFIPFAPGNLDYAEYIEWVADGNEPLPADEAPSA